MRLPGNEIVTCVPPFGVLVSVRVPSCASPSSLAKGKGSDYGVSLDGKTLTVTNAEGKVLGELTKVVRESKTKELKQRFSQQ